MAKIIAICGKICSGKTYYANSIKEKENAIILSCDEITSELFNNNLGCNHDVISSKIQNYLKKKSVELVKNGCTVILDWGFWTFESRRCLREYYRLQSIPCQWHYIDVDEQTWHKNIEERNNRILNGNSDSDYFMDEDLMNKLLGKWEPPLKEEIDVWHYLK